MAGEVRANNMSSYNSNSGYMQPIIRGVQSVGAVQIYYRYNRSFTSTDGTTPVTKYVLPFVSSIKVNKKQGDPEAGESVDGIIMGSEGIPVAGFRLDSEFLRANPQIASSFVIPILGGGGVALTNNNRTGTLNLVCTKVTAPNVDVTDESKAAQMLGAASEGTSNGLGVLSDAPYWDFVTLAQIQQAQEAGDSVGAKITIKFYFCNVLTTITFEGCTIATVDPIGLAGNDAVNYAIAVNYLNWTLDYTQTT